MKKIIFITMFLASSLSFTSPTWIEYLIKVDSPQNAEKIVAATDKFMSSEFVKNNFKGSLHLNAYIAGGKVQETHSFAVLQPSLAEHEIWVAKLSNPDNEEVRRFGSVLNANSEAVGTRINTFIQTYGTPSNKDTVWAIYPFRTQPSNVADVVEATEDLDEAVKDSFPGQFGLSARMAGGGMQTHLFTVGYESLAEMEQWEDSASRDTGVSPFDKKMDKLVEWHEVEIVRNIRVYDSALTLQDFVE
tara:strand:- start:315 stop:1052 length:738 start_codon:yes stop_codon:yes gene_type:complete